ncbi:hypothetical protein JX266_014348, partial [Neoarthrinium moseri]
MSVDPEYQLAAFYKDNQRHKVFSKVEDYVIAKLEEISKDYQAPTDERGQFNRPYPVEWALDQSDVKKAIKNLKEKMAATQQHSPENQQSNAGATGPAEGFTTPEASSTPRRSKEESGGLFTLGNEGKATPSAPSTLQKIVGSWGGWRSQAPAPGDSEAVDESFESANDSTEPSNVFSSESPGNNTNDTTLSHSSPKSQNKTHRAQTYVAGTQTSQPTPPAAPAGSEASTAPATSGLKATETRGSKPYRPAQQRAVPPTPTPAPKNAGKKRTIPESGTGMQRTGQPVGLGEFIRLMNPKGKPTEVRAHLENVIKASSSDHQVLLRPLLDYLIPLANDRPVTKETMKIRMKRLQDRLDQGTHTEESIRSFVGTIE